MLNLFRKKKKADANPREELTEILGDYDLPSFPGVVTTALEKVRDDDAPAGAIADLLATDPGVSVRLLGTVNSAAFALRHEVKSVHHAVSLIGRSQLESLLISMAVRQAIPHEHAEGFDPKVFWTASARRATVGRALAELIDPATRSESFTACLLEDLAIPVLAQRKGPRYGELLGEWRAGDEELAALEQAEFGWDHAWVGECMCKAWEFPERIAKAIGTHHAERGEAEGALPAARLVSVLREVDDDTAVERLADDVQAEHGFPRDHVVALTRSAFEDAGEIARLFG